MPKLEIIAIDAEDARQAQSGGADSVELVADMSVGGLTPTLETIQTVREVLQIKLYVMLRPHAQNFIYSPSEMDTIFSDLEKIRALGADGVVFGSLDADGRLNLDQLRQVVAASSDLRVTLHRAIDECAYPEEGLAAIQGLVTRVLSSGGKSSVDAGQAQLANWVKTYGQAGLDFVCGGGVRLDNLRGLVKTVQAAEYHVGSAARRDNRVDSVLVAQLAEQLHAD